MASRKLLGKHKCKRAVSRRKKRKLLKLKAMKLKGNFCRVCGYNQTEHPEAFDFHHTDPDDKGKNIAGMITNNTSFTKVAEELDKCILLCAVCHRVMHKKKRRREREEDGQ